MEEKNEGPNVVRRIPPEADSSSTGEVVTEEEKMAESAVIPPGLREG